MSCALLTRQPNLPFFCFVALVLYPLCISLSICCGTLLLNKDGRSTCNDRGFGVDKPTHACAGFASRDCVCEIAEILPEY